MKCNLFYTFRFLGNSSNISTHPDAPIYYICKQKDKQINSRQHNLVTRSSHLPPREKKEGERETERGA